MKKLFFVLLAVILLTNANSQPLTVLPNGGNKKAFVGERVGLTDITIHYNRPAVKGREGKIWGQLVHSGFTDQGFGSSKAAPWRAGANEATVIEFSNDVMIEGKPLKKGKYGFFVAYDSTESTAIFSTTADAWGSYYYNDKDDALRVKVKPVKSAASVEWLKYEFTNQTESAASIALLWENLVISFKVETAYLKDQVALFREELRTNKGFTWEAWDQAAQWAVQHNTNLDEALLWSDSATGVTFGGNTHFGPKATKAQLLEKLGRSAEAAALMKQALPLATMQELHNYGRSLLTQKKTKEALEVFQMNYATSPKEFTTTLGMARGYAANADYKNALKFALLALPLAPNAPNKTAVEGMVEKLKTGKPI